MDLLKHVRDIAADVDLSDEQYERVGAAVDELLEQRPRRARRRLRIGIMTGGLVVGLAAATAVVIVSMGAPHTPVPIDAVSPPGHAPSATVEPAPIPEPAEPTAARVLEDAALATLSQDAPVLDGKYLLVSVRTEYLVTYEADGQYHGVPRADAEAAWWAIGTYDTYIPADRSGEWVRVFNGDTHVTDRFGPDTEALVAGWLADAAEVGSFTQRSQGGLRADPGMPAYLSDAYFAEIPREPAEALEWYYSSMGKDASTSNVVQLLIHDLETNAAPADLRATLFRALSLIDGVHVESIDGSVTTVGFDFPPGQYYRRITVSVDTETGMFVRSTTRHDSDSALVPDSVPDTRITSTTTVVDAAP